MNFEVNLTDLLSRRLHEVINAGAMEIRNVDNGDEPFLYASGWRGPGYVMIKGLVSHMSLFKSMVQMLAIKVANNAPGIQFVAGNVTGGVIPGWLLSNYLSFILNRDIPFVWIRETRAAGKNKYPIFTVDKGLLEEAVVNFCINFDDIEKIDFVAGASPGGMVLGHRIAEELSLITQRTIPFVYVRDVRKKGGHKEIITGHKNNSHISKGKFGLPVGQVCNFLDSTKYVAESLLSEGYSSFNPEEVVKSIPFYLITTKIETPLEESNIVKPGDYGIVTEELVNFAGSTCNSALALRDLGFNVNNAATLLYYGNPKAFETLVANKIEMTPLFTLSDLLFVAEEYQTHPLESISKYKEFLKDPIKWNKGRGYEQVKEGGTL